MADTSQQNMSASFGSQEEYNEFLKLKEQKKEQELREKIMVEVREKIQSQNPIQEIPQPKGKVGKINEEKLAETFKGYVISSQDEYSRGNFLTRM